MDNKEQTQNSCLTQSSFSPETSYKLVCKNGRTPFQGLIETLSSTTYSNVVMTAQESEITQKLQIILRMHSSSRQKSPSIPSNLVLFTY